MSMERENMGYWYWRPLKLAWAVDENTTNRLDLPEKGHLSALFMRVYGTAARSLDTRDNTQPVQYRSVRIVGNGNYEIINCRARQLHAINFWDSGQPDPMPIITLSGFTPGQNLIFPFGRYPGDPKYGLILEKFAAGVQFEDNNTISTSDYTDGTSKFDIYGLMRKSPEPGLFSGGFLKKRQVYNRDTASAAQYPVKLPTEAKLRQIHLFSEPDLSSGVEATDLFTNASRIWLGIKSREEYIWDNQVSGELARFMHNLYGRVAQTHNWGGDRQNDVWEDTFIYYRHVSAISLYHHDGGFAWEDDSTLLSRCCEVKALAQNLQALARTFEMTSKGICLHGDIPLLMIDPKESDEPDWLDAKADADVYVEVTESNVGNWYIVLDELEKAYPT